MNAMAALRDAVAGWRARHFLHALWIGLATQVATGLPLGYWAGFPTMLNTWSYHSLQFGLPLVLGVRWADRMAAAGARPWKVYGLAIALTVLLGVWPVAWVLWPVLGKADWWTWKDDLWLATHTTVVLTLGVGAYASWRGATQIGERLQQSLSARDAGRRQLLLTRWRALQARVDPALLFKALQGIRARLGQDEQDAQRRLDQLIRLLRALLPRVGEGSNACAGSLAEEIDLLEIYAEVAELPALQPPRLLVSLRGAAGTGRFPPMLLLPLLRELCGPNGAHWLLSACVRQGMLHVEISCDAGGVPQLRALGHAAVEALRERLRSVQGDLADVQLRLAPEERLDLILPFDPVDTGSGFDARQGA